MIARDQILEARGATVLTADGSKAGTVEDIYLDRDTDNPEWALINTGLFGTRFTFVPMTEARSEGNDILVPYTKDQIKGAPNMDANGELSQEDETDLYAYYGLTYSEHRSDSGLPANDASASVRPEGYDTSGPTTDDAMTRSEEELHVGKTRRERGRARLKKYVITEQVRQTVPVKREETRLEREPITEANVDRAMAGPDISEEEHEIVLHREEPVVEKRTVPKDRVRLSRETVTEDVQISEQVRKEQIEQEGDIRS
ncbi:MAG TPA: PRC and DUF2382 domain-containing protein [Thermomicrobiales bacterium]|nr:PRC and DUF2382 domain-containing protein [Thermomicrobiales bacterium]